MKITPVQEIKNICDGASGMYVNERALRTVGLAFRTIGLAVAGVVALDYLGVIDHLYTPEMYQQVIDIAKTQGISNYPISLQEWTTSEQFQNYHRFGMAVAGGWFNFLGGGLSQLLDRPTGKTIIKKLESVLKINGEK